MNVNHNINTSTLKSNERSNPQTEVLQDDKPKKKLFTISRKIKKIPKAEIKVSKR